MKPRQLDEATQSVLAAAFEANWPVEGPRQPNIKDTTGLSRAAIFKRQRCWRTHGTIYPPLSAQLGAPRVLNERQGLFVPEYLSGRPHAFFAEIILELVDEWPELEGRVLPRQIGRVLKERGWTRKIARRVAKERNVLLRALWCKRSWRWPIDRLIFIDETACNQKTG